MKKLFNQIYILLGSLLLLPFCSSDDIMTPVDDDMMVPVVQPIHLLKKTILNDTLFSERFYSSDSLLTSIHYFRADTVWRKQNYAYNGDTIQVDDTNSADELTNYKKYFPVESDKVHVDRFKADHTPRSTGIYYFSSIDSCGYETLEFFNPDGMLTTTYSYFYDDPNCKVTAFIYDENGILTFKDEYARDDKQVHIQSDLLELLRINNLGSTISYNAWDENDQLLPEISYTQNTTYNTDDYPIQIIRNYLNGAIETYTFEYY